MYSSPSTRSPGSGRGGGSPPVGARRPIMSLRTAVSTPRRTGSSPTAQRRGTPPSRGFDTSPRERVGAPSSSVSPSVEFRGFVARQRTFSGDERAGALLREAALRGDLVGTVRWLAAGAEQAAVANSADSYGTTALHNACQYNRTEIVQTLMASGVDCNVADTAGRTPLHQACQFGATAIVRELLHAGAHLVSDNAGMTGRDYAVRHAHDTIVEIIDSAAALSSTRPEQTVADDDHLAGIRKLSTAVNIPRAAVSVTSPTGSTEVAKKMEEAPEELSQKMSTESDAHGVVVDPSSLVFTEPSYEAAVKKAVAVADAAKVAHSAVSQARARAAVADSGPPEPSLEVQQVSPSSLARFDQSEDPSDPMATIRRLARQYRSKHFHQHLAARHDAVRAI